MPQRSKNRWTNVYQNEIYKTLSANPQNQNSLKSLFQRQVTCGRTSAMHIMHFVVKSCQINADTSVSKKSLQPEFILDNENYATAKVTRRIWINSWLKIQRKGGGEAICYAVNVATVRLFNASCTVWVGEGNAIEAPDDRGDLVRSFQRLNFIEY
jgi:hypothetical protein